MYTIEPRVDESVEDLGIKIRLQYPAGLKLPAHFEILIRDVTSAGLKQIEIFSFP
jgi:hypothetical protein